MPIREAEGFLDSLIQLTVETRVAVEPEEPIRSASSLHRDLTDVDAAGAEPDPLPRSPSSISLTGAGSGADTSDPGEEPLSRISLLLLTFCFVATSTYALETEQKNEEWAADIRQAVVSAVEKAPELSERETLIYSSLMELPPLGSAISLDQSLSLKEMFNDLVSEGSYPAFLQAIEDNVELEAFLRQRRIIPTHPTCNCSVSGWFECNDGWECADTTCTSAEGSTHSGVCVKEEDNLSNVFGPTFDTSFLLN